ncbi:transglycosylase domain-containing protein [Chitinimonas naiadis]
MRRWLIVWFVFLLLLVGFLVVDEMQTSSLQARFLSAIGPKLSYKVEPGPSTAIRFPKTGPYDDRFGYSKLPGFTQTLKTRGFAITAQARMSPTMVELTDEGLFPTYREKSSAGLELFDCNARSFYAIRSPERLYDRFESVPPLISQTLLFIENHELLDADHPKQNPAVSWGRLARVLGDQVISLVRPSHPTPGASTLATQIEKFRHSPGGQTSTRSDKLRQMASASVRAYQDGPETMAARQRIVVDYLNTVPLSAKAGYGEISGLGDGLWTWYGRDLAEVNTLLQQPFAPVPTQLFSRQVHVYKEVLSLMLAQRAPSYYLRGRPLELEKLTAYHLNLLAEAKVIPITLRDAARKLPLKLRLGPVSRAAPSFVNQKAATVTRVQLSSWLGMADLYALDRLDLSAHTTLNDPIQQAVSEKLRRAGTVEGAKAAGMFGYNMLKSGDDPSRLLYSFTLLERGPHANLLRVQTDSGNAPFDINQGARLNLGSTAKLRTVVHYMQIMAELHAQYAALPPEELARIKPGRQDALRVWAVDYLRQAEDKSLRPMLEAALARSYSGNPSEVFYTGGGAQSFTNFDPVEDHRSYNLSEALQHSVNLVYVRVMRDMVRYHMAKFAGTTEQILADPVARQTYLARFADMEGTTFMARFYRNYRGKSPQEIKEQLLQQVRPESSRFATVLRSIEPEAPFERFAEQMNRYLPNKAYKDSTLRDLYDKYGVDKYSLADRGYLARVHPLEMWLVQYLLIHPQATMTETLAASRDARQQAYAWLLQTRTAEKQDKRIKYMQELEAYQEIGKAWRAVGYPFAAITPSYASSIGAAGDRPAALAELMGIIVNGGVRMPVQSLTHLNFAYGTPYETRFDHTPAAPTRVMPQEVADLARELLLQVVNGGTAIRIKGAYVRTDGTVLDIGGKTGTGDHRYEVYARGGGLIESRKVNRSATFVFMLGDRFYGTITAFVREPYAEKYTFTSSMTVQLLKSLAADLMPEIDPDSRVPQQACRDTGVDTRYPPRIPVQVAPESTDTALSARSPSLQVVPAAFQPAR